MVVAAAVLPVEAHARRSATPSTGLRTVAYAKAPPDFSFDVGDGRRQLSQLAGKPVVLNFWASWCHPCRDELDAFTKLQAAYGGSVALLTLSDEPGSDARDYLAGRGITLPLVEDTDKRIFSAYSVATIPVTIVLRADGTVSAVTIGELSWDELRAQVGAVAGPPSGPGAAPAASSPEASGAPRSAS